MKIVLALSLIISSIVAFADDTQILKIFKNRRTGEFIALNCNENCSKYQFIYLDKHGNREEINDLPILKVKVDEMAKEIPAKIKGQKKSFKKVFKRTSHFSYDEGYGYERGEIPSIGILIGELFFEDLTPFGIIIYAPISAAGAALMVAGFAVDLPVYTTVAAVDLIVTPFNNGPVLIQRMRKNSEARKVKRVLEELDDQSELTKILSNKKFNRLKEALFSYLK